MKKIKIALVFAAVIGLMVSSCKPKEKCPAYGKNAYHTKYKPS